MNRDRCRVKPGRKVRPTRTQHDMKKGQMWTGLLSFEGSAAHNNDKNAPIWCGNCRWCGLGKEELSDFSLIRRDAHALGTPTYEE